MNERRREEAVEQRVLDTVEDVVALARRLSDVERRLVLVERRLDNLVLPATSGRLAAVEAAIASIREWQAEADERLDWRRRPSAE